jgi:hypothetical protein
MKRIVFCDRLTLCRTQLQYWITEDTTDLPYVSQFIKDHFALASILFEKLKFLDYDDNTQFSLQAKHQTLREKISQFERYLVCTGMYRNLQHLTVPAIPTFRQKVSFHTSATSPLLLSYFNHNVIVPTHFSKTAHYNMLLNSFCR